MNAVQQGIGIACAALLVQCVGQAMPDSQISADPAVGHDPSRCGDFSLRRLETLCESLREGCQAECSDLQAAVGVFAFQIATHGERQIGLFCGSYLFTWFRPGHNVGEECFPRPDCFSMDVRYEPVLHDGQLGWMAYRTRWWGDDGICREVGTFGAPVLPARFMLRNAAAVYLETGPHGESWPRDILDISLAEYFAALGVKLDR